MRTSILIVLVIILILNAIVILAKVYKGQEHKEKRAQLKEYCNGQFGMKGYKIYRMYVNEMNLVNALIYTSHPRRYMGEEHKWYLIKENQKNGYTVEIVEELH